MVVVTLFSGIHPTAGAGMRPTARTVSSGGSKKSRAIDGLTMDTKEEKSKDEQTCAAEVSDPKGSPEEIKGRVVSTEEAAAEAGAEKLAQLTDAGDLKAVAKKQEDARTTSSSSSSSAAVVVVAAAPQGKAAAPPPGPLPVISQASLVT